jgi:MFS family permease
MSELHAADQLEAEILAEPPVKVFAGSTHHSRKFEQLVARTEKRNFTLGVWNGILYNLAMYFMARSTIIPQFLSKLTTSSALIGIVSQFDSIGWYLPQIFFATYAVHRPQKMPLYRFAMRIGMVAYFLIAIITLINPSPTLLLTLFIIAYGSYHLSGGMRGVAFMELLAKAIPSRRRGRFLGWRMSMGAVAAATIGAGSITAILTADDFPRNFGWLFLVGAVIATVSFMLMASMREPRTPNVPGKRTMKEQLLMARHILKVDKRFRVYTACRMLINCWTIGLPFVILFGRDELGFTTKDTGIFIAAECVGLIVANIICERVELRQGPKRVLIIGCLIALAMPIFLLAFKYLHLPVYLFALSFSLTAAFDAAITIGGMGYLIEMTDASDRSTYVGVFNSLMALPCFLTAGAGLLLDLLGYQALYGVVFAIAVVSLYFVRQLPNIQLKHHG